MAIIRWDPFRDMMTIRDKMNRLFEDSIMGREESGILHGTWIPSVDIYEGDKELVMTAEVPGIEDKDIEVKVEDNTLTIKGERKMEKETKEENYHRIERSYGSFYRSFALPNYLDFDKVKAEHQNGVLKITIPKRSESKSRSVRIVKTAQGAATEKKVEKK